MLSPVPILTTPILFSSVHLIVSHINSSVFKTLSSLLLAYFKPLLWQSHWLPVHSIIRFKLATTTYKAFSTNVPQYPDSQIYYHQPVRSLHSSDQHYLLSTPFTTNFGFRSFSSVAPVTWNSIPLEIHSSSTANTFERNLKTHYFSFPPAYSSPHTSDSFMTYCTSI